MATKSELDRMREEQDRLAQRRRADNYQARLWRDRVIETGRYQRERVPAPVIQKMIEARAVHLRRADLAAFDPSGPLGEPVETFPYTDRRSRHGAADTLAWCVHPCGSVTIDDVTPCDF